MLSIINSNLKQCSMTQLSLNNPHHMMILVYSMSLTAECLDHSKAAQPENMLIV